MIGAFVFFAAFTAPAFAAEPVRLWKATPARPYVLRGAERRLLDRAEQFIADEQWDDAIAAVMRLLESDNYHVVAVDEYRYLNLTDYCHWLLSQLPAEPLSHYRKLVDVTAETWYRQGIENRDSVLLRRVVDMYFCSHWGDDALFALGELALQRGDYQAARNAWLPISPQLGIYPHSDISPATIQARLALVSVREGDWERADRELAELRESSPGSTGWLGGREGVLVEEVAGLLKQARQRPDMGAEEGWRTFAASSQRTSLLPRLSPKGPYELIWSLPIENEQLSIFPVVVNDLIIYQDATSVRAYQLPDGEQVFNTAGKVFHSPIFPAKWIGQSWHTLTANNRYVFGVTTSPLGSQRKSKGSDRQSTLWSLDLQRDGAIALHQSSEDADVAFVGSPIVEGTQVYVPIRSHDQTARIGIACYDLSTGERNWQRWLCQANTPATGWTNEVTCNLLTYDSGILYVNTNLGAIAAVRSDDGKILWLHAYERQSAELDSEGNCVFYRGPSPCVFHRGVVVALPTDSESLFAFDATTGEELWRHEDVAPTVRIVGVLEGHLLLSSEGFLACDLRTGQMLGQQDPPWGGLPFTYQANFLSVGEYVVAAGQSQISVYRNQPPATASSQKKQTSSKE